MVVPIILWDRSVFVMAKNGVDLTGVAGARGSFSMAGL